MRPIRLLREFFSRIADPQAVWMILEQLPGVFYFVKDDQGRLMAANAATCLRCGVKEERDLIGASDADFLPADIARAYLAADKKVMRTGNPLTNRLELFYDEEKKLDWFPTAKLPLRDRRGKVIGVISVARRDEKRIMHHDIPGVMAAVKFARVHTHVMASAAEMAGLAVFQCP